MSDIRKIQTGNNQYTLHARVSDKLAVSAQIGSTTKPVYVDNTGQVQACNNMAVSETIAANADLDTYKTPGFYNAGGSRSITHAPTSNSDGLGLLVIHDATGQYYTQIAFPHTGGVYRRNCSNGTWENWVKLEDFTTTYKTKLDGIEAGANKTIVDTILDNSSTNPVQNKVINEELSKKADKSQLSSYVTTATANDTYAKKSDISAVYKYKGSVNKVSDLPNPSNLTASNAGEVYNVGTASSGTNITVKSGDNVAWVWDSTTKSGHWDNLSGTVDLSNYLQKGGKQTTTSTADGGNNIYTFKDGSTITVKNGSKGSTGPQGPQGPQGNAGTSATWFSGGAVTGTSTTAKTFTVSGSKAGDMYLNTGTSNVYRATAANQWVYLCNIKGPQGMPGNNGTTPTIHAAAGANIGAVGTPSVKADTSGTTTTFTFNNLKGQKGDTGATITWHTGTAISTAGVHAIANAKLGDMYLNTTTCDVFKATNAVQGTPNWSFVCNIKGAKGDAADIPKLAKGVAGIVPGTINDNLSAYRWLNGGDNGTGAWRALPTAGGGTSGMVRTCKDYTGSIDPTKISGYAHGTTPPTLQPITTGTSDYRGVESDASGLLFVNVPAYEKNINRAQNTVLAAPTTGTGTATFRKLTSSDIPWNDRFKVMTPAQYKTATKLTNVFYFILEE